VSKIVLMPNKEIGKSITKYLIENGDQITAIFLTDEDENYNSDIIQLCKIKEENVFVGKKLHNDEDIVNNLPEFDFAITIYWPYLITDSFLNKAKHTVNFHPALLPINRGWYPHVHSLIDGSPFGVTLHSIDSGTDTGPIWAQKELDVDVCMDAGEIHSYLQNSMETLFKDKWNDISSGHITPFVQDESKSVYHSKKEIDSLDEINLELETNAKDLFNFLRARSFGNRSFSYFKKDGEKIFVKIKLSRNNIFDE